MGNDTKQHSRLAERELRVVSWLVFRDTRSVRLNSREMSVK